MQQQAAIAAAIALVNKVILSSGFSKLDLFCISDLWTSDWPLSLVPAGTSMLHAMVGSWVMRHRRINALNGIFLCVVLASSACGTSYQIYPFNQRHNSLGVDFLIGARDYVGFWGPMVLVALLVFGYPLRRAQRASREGLRSQDCAERMIGITASLVGIVASAMCTLMPSQWLSRIPQAWALSAAVLGTATATDAHRRIISRTRFLVGVRAGQHAQFALSDSVEGARFVQLGFGELAYRSNRLERPLLDVLSNGDVRPRT